MQAIEAVAFGGPEVLEVRQFPAPAAGAGEVVIDVAAAPVLFLDTQIRAGLGRDWFPARPPYVPGAGVAGTVGSAGAGVGRQWAGCRVQLAHQAGARVIGAARGEKKLALVTENGADPAVDYSQRDWAGQAARITGGAGPTLVLDGSGP